MSADELLADLRAATVPGSDGSPLMICLHGDHLSLVKQGVRGLRHVPLNLKWSGGGVMEMGRPIFRKLLAASREVLDAKAIRWEGAADD